VRRARNHCTGLSVNSTQSMLTRTVSSSLWSYLRGVSSVRRNRNCVRHNKRVFRTALCISVWRCCCCCCGRYSFAYRHRKARNTRFCCFESNARLQSDAGLNWHWDTVSLLQQHNKDSSSAKQQEKTVDPWLKFVRHKFSQQQAAHSISTNSPPSHL
jgi:hypothetical protein